MISQLSRYLSVGVLNTGAGLSIIFACKGFFNLADVPANIIGYSGGLLLGFVFNRKWTFDHTGNAWWALIRYALAFVAAYSGNLLVVLFLINEVGLNSYLAQAIGILPYTMLFFLLSKYFVFRQSVQSL